MATITLRIDDDLKTVMDELDKVNWSAVTREFLEEEVKKQWISERRNKALKEYSIGKYFTHDQVMEMSKEWGKKE